MALLAVNLPPSKTSLDNHAAYIGSWLKLLREDKGEIFRAAALAQKATDYLCERAMRLERRQPGEKLVGTKCDGKDDPVTSEPDDETARGPAKEIAARRRSGR